MSRERTLELWQWCTTSWEHSVRLRKGRKSESLQNETLLYKLLQLCVLIRQCLDDDHSWSNRMDFPIKNCWFTHCCARMFQIYIDNWKQESKECNMAVTAPWLTFYSLLVTWCTNSLTFNKCTFCPHCIYVFCIYLRSNSDLCHLQYKLIGFCNSDEKCLLHGMNWVFK